MVDAAHCRAGTQQHLVDGNVKNDVADDEFHRCLSMKDSVFGIMPVYGGHQRQVLGSANCCGLYLYHFYFMFRPEHRVIIGGEVVMTLVGLLNFSDIFAVPV